KILAAKRAGIETIILSADNQKDIEEIAPAYIEGLHFIYARDISDVLRAALLDEKVANAIEFDFEEAKN
ncbi:MAG: hypothetical protein K2G08_01520, partial [Paramuribaculum sp.]|nr:hypothetical protein [Paramuribaculum sp.]